MSYQREGRGRRARYQRSRERAGSAPAPGAVLWLISLASMVLVFIPASNRYFRPQSAALASPAG